LKDIVAIDDKRFLSSTEAREIAENVLFTNANWWRMAKKTFKCRKYLLEEEKQNLEAL
jgi:pectinesterase